MRNYIYLAIIAVVLFLIIQIWYIVNVPTVRDIGYLIWEGIISILIIGVSGLLANEHIKRKKMSKGVFYIFGIYIISLIIMMNYATVVTDLSKLQFYFHLAISTAIIILVATVANIIGIEKKDEGFHIHIHDKDSPITTQLIIPIWIMTFIAMGTFVTFAGSVLVSYPEFGILPGLASPAVSGFGVGSWEDIIFIFTPIALTAFFMKNQKMPHASIMVVTIIIGAISFVGYHSYVYETNAPALVTVAIFGFISAGAYKITRSITIPSAIHIGNNFFGALFKKTVFGLSAVEGTGGNILISMFALVTVVTLALVMIKFFGKSSKRKKKGKGGFKIFILVALGLMFISVPIVSADAGYTLIDSINTTNLVYDDIWYNGTYLFTAGSGLDAFTFDGSELTIVDTDALGNNYIWVNGTYIYTHTSDQEPISAI